MDIKGLNEKINLIWNKVRMEEKIILLTKLKENLYAKKNAISTFSEFMVRQKGGHCTRKFLQELKEIENAFNDLYENFDDKIMIFIVGNGNVGKSTLINALIGYKMAETNFLPNTWKIDTYSSLMEKDSAIIKYNNGDKVKLPIVNIKKIVQDEEEKAKEGRRLYNQEFKKADAKATCKEEREEIKQYMAEKYIYKSQISEVIWPVNKNWLFEKSLLVDTPGLNQSLNDITQIGSIHDYYHKADGILWLMDGETISAENIKSNIKELHTSLACVGGIRNNIIGIINRIDKVKKNGGQAAVDKVIKCAKDNFEKEFYNIIPISAKQAYEGISKSNKDDIEDSGILDLKKSIEDIFLQKAETIKKTAKVQGSNRLTNLANKQIDFFLSEVHRYQYIFNSKVTRLETQMKKLEDSLNQEIEQFFQAYIQSVDTRIENYIDELGKGKRETFVKEQIYRISDLEEGIKDLVKKQEYEIQSNVINWHSISYIGRYKYISDKHNELSKNIRMDFDFSFKDLGNLEYFSPSLFDDFESLIGNVWGKIKFLWNRNGIKSKLRGIICNSCDHVSEQIKSEYNKKINQGYEESIKIARESFSNLIFDIKNINDVSTMLTELKNQLNIEQEITTIDELLL